MKNIKVCKAAGLNKVSLRFLRDGLEVLAKLISKF